MSVGRRAWKGHLPGTCPEETMECGIWPERGALPLSLSQSSVQCLPQYSKRWQHKLGRPSLNLSTQTGLALQAAP